MAENVTKSNGARDHLVRALACGGTIRALALTHTEVARTLARLHDASPLGAVVLSRAGGAALMLGGMLKGREQVGLQLKGDGPVGTVYAVADAHGDVRVSIDEPQVDLGPAADGRWPVPKALGMGRLTVTRSHGLKEPYVGVVPMVTGEVAEDLAEYFQSSEQKPAAVAISEVLGPEGVRLAGGFLIQALPGAEEAALDEVEARVRALPPLSRLLAEGVKPEEVLARLLGELLVLEEVPVQVRCHCDRQRFEGLMASLGADELRSLAAAPEREGTAEIVCHFCNTRYYFRAEELLALAETAGTS